MVSKGSGGNLGHVSRPGSQDNLRVESKALFAPRKCLDVPDPLDGGECNQERCLNRHKQVVHGVYIAAIRMMESSEYLTVY